VDEYQDTNRAQYQLVKLLGGEHGNVLVVGDDDQSIYGWRGADIRNILDFEKDFPNAKVVRLEENYRSTPQVLELANVVFVANTRRRGKTLRPTRPAGERVSVVGCLDERDEAEFVAEEIAARQAAERDVQLRDFAVLYRTNAQSRALEEALRRRAIPYRLVGAVRFYDRREIRDLMSYLKLIANPADDEAFRRAVSVPRRGLGEATIEALGEAARRAKVPMLQAASDTTLLGSLRPAARQGLEEFAALIARFRARATDAAVDELLRELVLDIGYAEHLKADGPDGAERLENVRELITGAAETVADEGGELGLTPLDHFLQRASLITDFDRQDPDADAVTMMTLHNAKGLEFPVVFITGLEEGLFPLSRVHDEPDELEEERRLFYVGITRAERKLYMSHARSRRRSGEAMPSVPSSFLASIPPDMLEQRATIRLRATGRAVLPQSPSARRPGRPVALRSVADSDVEASQDAPRFVKGERVKHARFGSGTVVELSGVGRDMKVTVDFDDEAVGRKRLVVAYAGLERGWD
jgi:DNA helicase-2/ATP-dependent DNA helicase PcrA